MARAVNVAIVGAGPAGISAAIFLKRAGLEPVLYEQGVPGGLLRNANLVENYPGFPGGIRGEELADLFTEQMETLGIGVRQVRVAKVSKGRDAFAVRAGRSTVDACAVILATGTCPRELGVKGETALKARRLFYQAVDMPLRRTTRKDIVIIGGGDAAFDYALNLESRGHRVTVVSRSGPRCLGLLEERADERGIEVLADTKVGSLEESEGGVVVIAEAPCGTRMIPADMVLVAVGRDPELSALDPALRKRLGKTAAWPETDVSGLYMVGDVVRDSHRQTGIAVGDGVRAAMLVQEYLNGRSARP